MFSFTENDRKLQILFDELVPTYGPASSLAGELIRAAMRLTRRWSNDGDQLGVGYGNETCNMAGRFLYLQGNEEIRKVVNLLWGTRDMNQYSFFLDYLTGVVADYVNENPELSEMPTDDISTLLPDRTTLDANAIRSCSSEVEPSPVLY